MEPAPSPPPAQENIRPARDAALAVATTLAVSLIGLGVIYSSASRAQFEGVQSELLQLATTTADQVDGSLHDTIRSPQQESSPEHRKVLEPLVRMQRAARDVIYVYTAVLQEGRIHWVLDSASLYRVPGDELPVDPIMTEYQGSDPALRRALEQQVATVNDEPVKEKVRTYLSAFAPIRDRNGRFSGVLGVDMVLDRLDARMAVIQRALLASVGASTALSLAIGAAILRLRRSALAALERREEDAKHLERAMAEAEKNAETARSSDQAKSAFLATMSHEVRTPMNGVLGIAELLRHTSLDSDQSRYVETIETSGRSLMRILNDILDLSKIDAGKVEIESRPFALRPLVDSVRQLLDAQASGKAIEVLTHVDASLPVAVTGDRERLVQVLLNLGANAVRFTETGQVELRVLPHPDSRASSRIQFRVSDTGIGIPEEARRLLFQPFSQVPGTGRSGGTGLGLAISQRLVHLMGGSIGVSSVVGKGSTFEFDLTLPEAQETAASSLGRVAGSESGSRLDILVAEDNKVNQIIALRMLEHLGHRVVLVGDGEEALRALEQKPYDLILMDCQMPKIDGFEATRAIRSTGRHSRLKIIAMTAGAMAGDRAACIAAGMDGYLTKPMSIEALDQTIGEVMGRTESRPREPRRTWSGGL